VEMNEGEIAAGLPATSNYRYADRVGTQLFVAGQMPLDSSRTLVGEGDPAAQARQCLDNLFTLVAHHGFTRDDIHRLTVYVVGAHQNLIAAWGAVTSCFEMNVPPATLVGVTVLGFVGQLVEIDAVIVRG
ncbi:MAG: RidA family protein, partial [Ilumatobacteraceae bacterium]